jgi:hypothetical protein
MFRSDEFEMHCESPIKDVGHDLWHAHQKGYSLEWTGNYLYVSG